MKPWQSLLPSVLWAAVIAFLLFSSGDQVPRWSLFQRIPQFDKIVHALLFGILAWLLLYGFEQQQKFRHQRLGSVLAALSLGLLYGGLTETLQYLLPSGRTADFMDFLADAAGIFAAFCLRLLWKRRLHGSLS